MGDKINLSRSVDGTILMEALEKAAFELGWRCERHIDHYSVSSGSAKAIPAEYRLDILIGRLLPKHLRTGIIPNKTYDSIALSGDAIGPEKLEMFASTLYNLLGQ